MGLWTGQKVARQAMQPLLLFVVLSSSFILIRDIISVKGILPIQQSLFYISLNLIFFLSWIFLFNKKELGAVYLDYRGIKVLGASRKIDDTDWYLVVEQDRDEAFQSADILKQYVYVMIALTIVIAVFIAWLITYYIVNPIRVLSQSANILADGEFVHP